VQSQLKKEDRELIQVLNGCNLYAQDLTTVSGQQWFNDKILEVSIILHQSQVIFVYSLTFSL